MTAHSSRVLYGADKSLQLLPENQSPEWLKSSIEIALEDPDVGEDLRSYMAEIVKYNP